jgi:hypothetical protein
MPILRSRSIQGYYLGHFLPGCGNRRQVMGLILIIILVIFLLGGFSGRFGGYGYGYGHGGVGIIGIILIVVLILLLTGRL